MNLFSLEYFTILLAGATAARHGLRPEGLPKDLPDENFVGRTVDEDPAPNTLADGAAGAELAHVVTRIDETISKADNPPEEHISLNKLSNSSSSSGRDLQGCDGNTDRSQAWHPVYSAGWHNGYCHLISDCNSPSYPTELACCKGEYTDQMSGFCLMQLPSSPTTSPTETGGLPIYYPRYDLSWGDAFCSNTRPIPSGRPTYSTMLTCCKGAYGGQISGKCISMLPAPPTSSATNSAMEAEFWYPMYETSWDVAGCSNKLPLPYKNINDRPNYPSQLECCYSEYGGQVSGSCLAMKSDNDIDKSNGAETPIQVDDFAYPRDMPPPPEMWVEGFASRLHAQNIQKYETPIQVWQTWRLDQTMWNCIAHYHPTALNAITKTHPVPRVSQQYHTSEARALCMIHAINKLVPKLVPISAITISTWLDDLGLDSTIMSDADAVRLATIEGSPSPRVIGSLVAAEVIEDMQSDGWNYKGIETPDGGTCTANCRPFTDTFGYVPKNSPWEVTDPIAWQPLIESDNLGFFFPQEHVTPHIGFKATPVILTQEELNATELDDPNYDLQQEALDAISNVESLDEYKKTMIEFMDNKINIAGGMIMRLRGKYQLSLEAQVFYHYGYTSSEHDAVLLAWKEKIRHDRIRPTSVVQALGDLEVASFAGTHKAKDWVPYIRVMPHAEYPSGSGCICLAVAQFIDSFLGDQYGATSIKTTWEFGDRIPPVTFAGMMDLVEVCGESRLWGGMHFSASVPDSYELCDGVGTKGYTDLMKPLLGTGTYAELMDHTKMKYGGDAFKEM